MYLYLYLRYISKGSSPTLSMSQESFKMCTCYLQGWNHADNATKLEAEQLFGCCGYDSPTQGIQCDDVERCKQGACPTCQAAIKDKINYAFNAAGGLGLFFSFTEVGVI